MPPHHLTALVMATLLEAEPFLESLSLKEIERGPFPCYRSDDTVLVISGIGKANAAMAAAYCCQVFRPAVVCNLGAAGATSLSCPLGAIYHIDRVTEQDRPPLQSDGPRVHLPHVLEGFPTASLATQDRPVIDAGERRVISRQADLVDMEAAAVLQACRRFGVACLVFKLVSDTPAHADHNRIAEHIKLYRDSFCRFFSTSVAPLLRIMSFPRLPEGGGDQEEM